MSLKSTKVSRLTPCLTFPSKPDLSTPRTYFCPTIQKRKGVQLFPFRCTELPAKGCEADPDAAHANIVRQDGFGPELIEMDESSTELPVDAVIAACEAVFAFFHKEAT